MSCGRNLDLWKKATFYALQGVLIIRHYADPLTSLELLNHYLMTQSFNITDYFKKRQKKVLKFTVCPRSLDPLHIVSCHIKWAMTSWTNGTKELLQENIYPCEVGWPLCRLEVRRGCR